MDDPIVRARRVADKALVVDVLTMNANRRNQFSIPRDILLIRFRWVFCRFAHLHRCLWQGMRGTLDDLPDTFEETHTHVGREIGNQNWECHTDYSSALQWRPVHFVSRNS